MALAKSSNPNEAATALRQAQAMMQQHGLSQLDVDASQVESRLADVDAGRKPPSYVVMLVNVVAKAFGVFPVYQITGGRTGYTAQVEFLGLQGRPEVAGYALEVLGRQLKRDRTAFLASLDKRLKRSTKTRRGDLYAEGWIVAMRRQVKPMDITDEESAAVDAYKVRRWEGPLDSVKPREVAIKARDVNAFGKGVEDGENVSFHQGVPAAQVAALTHSEAL